MIISYTLSLTIGSLVSPLGSHKPIAFVPLLHVIPNLFRPHSSKLHAHQIDILIANPVIFISQLLSIYFLQMAITIYWHFAIIPTSWT